MRLPYASRYRPTDDEVVMRTAFRDRKTWWWALGVVVLLLSVLGGALTHWSAGMLALIGVVTAVYLGVPVMAVALRQWTEHTLDQNSTDSSDAALVASAQPAGGEDGVAVTIADDGHFVGGDDTAVDLVLGLLQIPESERIVRVRATAADDMGYKRRSPDAYLRLRDALKVYESSLNLLMQGGARYYLPWQVADLAEAVIELRSLALPGIEGREWWFSWPPEEISHLLRIRFTANDARIIRSGYYRQVWANGGVEGIEGLPSDRPIWLSSIFPSMVWRRVIPAALLRSVQTRPADPQPVDVTGWVISDRHPDQLARKAPAPDEL
jgi:hypothetical protein